MPKGSKRKDPQPGVISQEELRVKAAKLAKYMSTSKQTSKSINKLSTSNS